MATKDEIAAARQKHDLRMRALCGGPTRIELTAAKKFCDVTEADWVFVLECLELGYVVRDNLTCDRDRLLKMTDDLIADLAQMRRMEPSAQKKSWWPQWLLNLKERNREHRRGA